MHNDSENSLICTTEIHCCMQKCAWVCVNKSLPSPCSWCYEAGNPIIPHLACITKNIIIGHKIIQPFQKSNLWTLWLYSSGWLHALWGSASFNGFNSACIISGCTLVWEKVGVKWLIFLLKCLGIFVWEQTPGSGQSFNILCMAFPKSKPNNITTYSNICFPNVHQNEMSTLWWTASVAKQHVCDQMETDHCLQEKWAYWYKITLNCNVLCY